VFGAFPSAKNMGAKEFKLIRRDNISKEQTREL
jgi:hypothetical protein